MSLRSDIAAVTNALTRDIFGEGNGAVVYTPTGGLATPIDAVFDDAHKSLVITDDGLQVSSTGPALDVLLSDLTPEAPAIGDTFTNGGKSYEVTDVQPDGHGWALCLAVQV